MLYNKKSKKKLLICFIILILLYVKYNNIYITEEWIKSQLNPVLGNKTIGTLFDPFVIIHDNLYKMYVSWRSKGAIALSTSKDGIHWSDLEIILNKGISQSWESIVNRASILFLDGKFFLFYTGQNADKSKIGLAISENGYNFTRYKNNPILKPEYEYEKQSVMNPHVIYDKDEKIFKMWYSAGEIIEPDIICYAFSKNGIKWIKYKNNPIFFPNPNKIYLDYYKVGGCDVHKISKKKYLMFYIGYSSLNSARIFVAESENGIHNWKRGNFPIIKPKANQFDSEACYKPSALYDNKHNGWFIWYNGRTNDKEYIGIAIYNNYNLFKKVNYIQWLKELLF